MLIKTQRRCLLVFIYAAVLLGAPAANAAIAAKTMANGELFLVVYDDVARVSYTKDLGAIQDDFFVAAQQDGGTQMFWNFNQSDDEYWDQFTRQADLSTARWAVMAMENFGGNAEGRLRLYTTVRQGDEGLLLVDDGAAFTNQELSNGVGSTQAGQFIDSVNVTGSHGVVGTLPDYEADGSSFNAESDDGFGYFGKPGGLSFNYNGNMEWNSTNLIGESSWFYYITRSGTNQAAKPLVDEFDNLGVGTDGDGYFGFIYVDEALYPDSPYAGDWLLSYTLQAAPGFNADALAFMRGIGRTEVGGGFTVTKLEGAAAAGLEPGAGFSRRLLGEAPAVSAVPEPGTLGLMAAGLMVLAGLRRRR